MSDVMSQPSGRPSPEPASTVRDRDEARQRRGTRQLLVAQAVFMVLSYLVSVTLARHLGPAMFGIYGLILSALAWLETVSYAGVPSAVGKMIADHHDETDAVKRTALFLVLLKSAGLFAIGWLSAPLIARLFDIEGGVPLFRLVLLDLPIMTLYVAYRGILMGERNFGPVGVSQITLGGTKLLGILVLIVLGMSVKGALVVYVLGTLAALLYMTVAHPPPGFVPSRRLLRELASLAIPMGVFSIALPILTSLDLWSLGSLWHGNEAVVGQYVAALKLGQTLTVIPVVQSGVVFASIAWALARKDRLGARRQIRDATRFALLLAVPACVIVGLSASSLLGVVYSSAYRAGGSFLVLQLVAFMCFGILDIFAHVLMAAGRQKTAATVLVCIIPLVLGANVLLIPRVGPIGAATSLMLGMVTAAAVMGGLVWRDFGAPASARTLARVGIAAGIVAIPSVLFHVEGPLVIVKIVLLGGVYLGVLWLMGEISKEDFVLPGVDRAAATE